MSKPSPSWSATSITAYEIIATSYISKSIGKFAISLACNVAMADFPFELFTLYPRCLCREQKVFFKAKKRSVVYVFRERFLRLRVVVDSCGFRNDFFEFFMLYMLWKTVGKLFFEFTSPRLVRICLIRSCRLSKCRAQINPE